MGYSCTSVNLNVSKSSGSGPSEITEKGGDGRRCSFYVLSRIVVFADHKNVAFEDYSLHYPAVLEVSTFWGISSLLFSTQGFMRIGSLVHTPFIKMQC